MRPRAELGRVLALVDKGLNDCAIAHQTGVPRTTVRRWRTTRATNALQRRNGTGCERCGHRPHEFATLPDAYVYLLGLYLGDGHITRHPRDVYRLSISLDQSYPGIVTECADAVRALLPDNRVLVQHGVGGHRLCVVSSYSKQWPCLFPQHGPGRKHERRIVLTDWQERLVAKAPGQLVRGLIHSDGCRFTNRVRAGEKRYEYTRYTFSNASADVRTIFCRCCELLGVEWRRMNARNISVARRASVVRLDELAGPKA